MSRQLNFRIVDCSGEPDIDKIVEWIEKYAV
jgi:hypothetical protein